MDLSFEMTVLGIVVLIVGAVALGVTLMFVGDVRSGYEWVSTSVAAFIGGFVASEYLGMQAFQPVWEGLALVPAIVGGLIVGFVVDLIARYASGGSLTHGPRTI